MNPAAVYSLSPSTSWPGLSDREVVRPASSARSAIEQRNRPDQADAWGFRNTKLAWVGGGRSVMTACGQLVLTTNTQPRCCGAGDPPRRSTPEHARAELLNARDRLRRACDRAQHRRTRHRGPTPTPRNEIVPCVSESLRGRRPRVLSCAGFDPAVLAAGFAVVRLPAWVFGEGKARRRSQGVALPRVDPSARSRPPLA